MTPTHDKHVQACALWVEKHHGERGPAFIAEQIAVLVLDEDAEGVEIWNEIAAAYSSLSARTDALL
jgi:hypothetical protein